MLLRSMKQAVYDPENRGHFGLALQSYAHFTSPIRRYPDLSLHRAIKYLLAKDEGHTGNSTKTGGWHYSMEEMLQLGQHCSMTERRADEATREVSDWLKCDFMQDRGQYLPRRDCQRHRLWLLCTPDRSVYRWSGARLHAR